MPKGEDWQTTIRRRINQVDRARLLTYRELAWDLGPHLSVTPFWVDEKDLEDFLKTWYTLHPWLDEWDAEDLAKAIIRHFNLRESGAKR